MGEKARYYHHEIGVNSRLDAPQARFFRLSYAIWILGIISVGDRGSLQSVPQAGSRPVTPQDLLELSLESIHHSYVQDQGTDSTAVSYRDNVRCLLKQRGVGNDLLSETFTL